MAFKYILLAVALLVAAVSAQTGGFSFQNQPTSVLRGVTSDPIFIIATQNLDVALGSEVTVTANAPGDVTVTPSVFTFSSTSRSNSFTVYSRTYGPATITFDISSEAQFVKPADLNLFFENRTFSYDTFSTTVATYVNEWSEPKRIVVDKVSASPLSFFMDVGNSSITFNPNPVVIPAGARSASFQFTSVDEISNDDISFRLEGADADLFTVRDTPTAVSYNFILRPFLYADALSKDVLVGYTGSNGFYVYTRQLPNKTFTVTPQAANTVFTPAQATFGPSQQSVLFNFVTSNPGNREVYLFTNGDGALDYELNPLDSVSLSVPKRQVGIRLSSTHVISNSSYMTIFLSAPVVNGLVVSFWAANLKFNESSVSFTSAGNRTSFAIAFQTAYFGPDTISFALSGADAANYADVPSVSITATAIKHGNFIFATNVETDVDNYYPSIDDLYVNVRSERIPIRASISPLKDVILVPTAPGLIFDPPQITFKNGAEQQYFTIFPTYSSLYSAGVSSAYTTTITWLVIGEDAPSFNEPEPVSVNVQPRRFQAVWSSHLYTDKAATSAQVYLHKTYKIWVSTHFVLSGEQVSVLPVSPFFKFSPSELKFDASTTRIELDATLTGIPADGASARIDYVLGGKDGGLYSAPTSQTKTAALRPLDIVAAVVSPDERSVGVYIADNRTNRNPTDPTPGTYLFEPSVLTNYHVSSFLIRSFALPDQELTITPFSPNLKFSPSKITIKARNAVKRIDWHTAVNIAGGADANYAFNVTGVYLEANFSVKALAPGTHVVRFDLQGADAQYYKRLPHTPMTFNLVSRPDSEPFKKSSSSFLFPSFVVVAVMAAFAMVL